MQLMQHSHGNHGREPSPNRGATVDAKDATPGQQSLDAWRRESGIDVKKQVKLVKLSHVRYQHKDFESITTFLKRRLLTRTNKNLRWLNSVDIFRRLWHAYCEDD